MASTKQKPVNAAEYSHGEALIRALQNPALYGHPVTAFTLIETHISWVLLTGDHAYKIKKPVNFGFVDFSTLDKRKYYCEEELRLNRRFAPDLYLEVVKIQGSQEIPRFGSESETIEYAVKMKEFAQSNLLSEIANKDRLLSSQIDSIADVVSSFHDSIQDMNADNQLSSADIILKWSQENFDKIESVVPQADLPEHFYELKTWCLASGNELLPTFNERQRSGFVRECHGDLHLGNIALIDNQITLFDCIEFNPELRWIDVMSEIAFVAMDLQARGYSEFAWRFISGYLEKNSDYSGLSLLRYYVVYRAMVRAKVEALSLPEEMNAISVNPDRYQATFHYLDIAFSWINYARPAVIVMHGLSGSGKSTLARQLVEDLGAIHIRSDVERKRLYSLKPDENSASPVDLGIYTSNATQLTYDRLAELAEKILKAGFNVIVDASFLKIRHRDQFRQLASDNLSACYLLSCESPVAVLRERIVKRGIAGGDPSEANIEVLNQQLNTQDVLSAKELEDPSTLICTGATLNAKQLEFLNIR